MIDYEVHLEQLVDSLEYQLEDREIKLARAAEDNYQLKARVAELEEGIQSASIGLGFSLCHGDGVVKRKEIRTEINNLDALVCRHKHPAQSLSLLKAQVLEGFIADLKHEGYLDKSTYDFAVKRVAQLRKEAGE